MNLISKITIFGACSIVGVSGLAGCGSAAPRSSPHPSRPTPASLLASSSTVAGSVPTVTAQGTGMVMGTPDTLTLGVGVSTTGVHAAEALGTNNALASAVVAALESHGVAAADIQTSNLSLQQNWGTSGPSGYAAEDDVTATIHNLSGVGTLIDEVLSPAGDAARLNEVQFSISNDSPLAGAARQQAVRSAEAQAAQMAAAAGDHLGPLVSLTDVTPSTPAVSTFAFASAGPASSAPIQAGSQQVSVEVTGVWQVIPGP